MSWFITATLMGLVLSGAFMFSAMAHGAARTSTTEPYLSYQLIDFGLGWLLASVIPFYRDQAYIGWVALGLGVFLFLQAGYGLMRYKRKQSR